MLWSALQPKAGWFITDIIYVVGLILLMCGLWLSAKKSKHGWVILLLGCMAVMLTFFTRFGMVLSVSGNWQQAKNDVVALTRSVLHTLVAPLGIIIVWSLGRLMRDHFIDKRKWWQTGSWVILVIGLAWWCSCVVYWIYTRFGTYPGESSFP